MNENDFSVKLSQVLENIDDTNERSLAEDMNNILSNYGIGGHNKGLAEIRFIFGDDSGGVALQNCRWEWINGQRVYVCVYFSGSPGSPFALEEVDQSKMFSLLELSGAFDTDELVRKNGDNISNDIVELLLKDEGLTNLLQEYNITNVKLDGIVLNTDIGDDDIVLDIKCDDHGEWCSRPTIRSHHPTGTE